MTSAPAEYMVIERYHAGAAPTIYRRFKDKGRMLPAGVEFLGSWVDVDLSGCFVLLRTAERSLIDTWIGAWSDLVEFKVVPVQTSAAAARASGA